MTRNPHWAEALADVPIRFWTCPIPEHGERHDSRGWPVLTVEWRGDIAYCTDPDCGRSSQQSTTVEESR